MSRLEFLELGWKKKLNKLLADIARNGNTGIGQPEPLKDNLVGWWSREIDKKNRLIYKVEGDLITVMQCKNHYDDKQFFFRNKEVRDFMFARKTIARLKKELDEALEREAKLIKSEAYLKSIIFNGIDGYLNDVYEAPQILFQWKDENKTEKIVPEELEEVLKNIEPSFSDRLFELIREKGLNEVEVYKKADIDRRHFSKIRSNSSYRPTKDTVILLCLSMELSFEEAQDLLKRAGLTLSRCSQQDIIAEYFLKRNIYDILLYKEVLYKYGFIKED